MNVNTTVMVMIRELWQDGLSKVESEREREALSDEAYFARLERVVEGIKRTLKNSGILEKTDVLVKHGDSAVLVTVDLPGMAVVPDPEDNTRALFSIPSVQKRLPDA
jgi:hypothetical protein